MKKMASLNREKLVDLLSERLLFERTGVDLYTALLERPDAFADEIVRNAVGRLTQIRFEEAEHAAWLESQLQTLGADPEAPTHRTEMTRRESRGIIDVVSDPEVSLTDAFHAILGAELVDHSGWNLLIGLAGEAHDRDAMDQIRQRLHEENDHLMFIRTVFSALVRRELTGVLTDVSRKAA